MSAAPLDLNHLPDDIATLKALLHDSRAEIDKLREQLHILLHEKHGPSSEKAPDEQMRLFNEAEAEADAVAEQGAAGLALGGVDREDGDGALGVVGQEAQHQLVGGRPVPPPGGDGGGHRHYLFGIFINDSTSDDTSGDTFDATKSELVREQIRDAVELPFLHADLFREHQLRPPKGILLYGPPGNGKSTIAEHFCHAYQHAVFVPHALEVDNQVITLYDPTVHIPIEGAGGGVPPGLASRPKGRGRNRTRPRQRPGQASIR